MSMADAQDVDNRPSKRSRLLSESNTAPSSSSKKTRGRRAALNNFIEMPLDILFETFGHLYPSDLLRLARTTKELRHALMSRTSRTIWKNARSNLEGLPDCPGDLSEPQYASLLFEHICQNCDASNSQQVIWTARAKFCKKCTSAKFEYWTLCNLSFLRQIVPSTLDLVGATRRRTLPKYYTEVALALKSEYEAIETDELQARWLSDKIAAFGAIKDHGNKCNEFMAVLNAKRSGDLTLIREARRDAIIEKLKALGWEDDLGKINLYRFSKLPDVNQPKALTERAWQKMESTLNTFMANERTLRLQSAIMSRCVILMNIYDSLRAHLPFNMAMPNVADVALLHSARSLILDTPYETSVTLADFHEVLGQLLDFCSSWLVVADEAVLDIVRNSSVGPYATHSTLPLATTLFNCSTCSNTLHYPRVLVHSCLQTTAPSDGDEPENLAYMFSCLKCRPWNWATNQTQITFDESAHNHMKALLSLYHLHPVPSYDDLQDSDPFVECLTTVSSTALKYEREVMRMTVAIDFSKSYGVNDFPWRALGEEDQVQAAVAEQSLNASDHFSLVPGVVLQDSVEIFCLHCAKRLFGPYEVIFHFQDGHLILKPTRFYDFTLHMDGIRSFERSYVIKISET
ncbi:hypothetical protein BYT27DRAFT_7186928 [Phlegmacium glaucopus]|nr:hypothetical protein BYT27DRAFT_7186928 [Phlegmacium glaucopus]